MSLSLWRHPSSGDLRVYVQIPLLKTLGISDDAKSKVWFEAAPNPKGWKIASRGDLHCPADQAQKRLLDHLKIPATADWEQLIALTSKPSDSDPKAKDSKAPAEISSARRLPPRMSASRLDLRKVHFEAPATIEVDVEEPDLIPGLVSQHCSVEVRRTPLPFGSFRVCSVSGDELIVDRKRCDQTGERSDLENAIRHDGKLFRESHALRQHIINHPQRVVPVVMIEGGVYDEAGSLLVNQIDGALSVLCAAHRISVLSTFNANHSAYLLTRLTSHFLSGDLGPSETHREKPRDQRQRQIHILESFPGMGEPLAFELLNHFGSLLAVMNASVNDLEGVYGIGPGRASQIHSLLRSGF